MWRDPLQRQFVGGAAGARSGQKGATGSDLDVEDRGLDPGGRGGLLGMRVGPAQGPKDEAGPIGGEGSAALVLFREGWERSRRTSPRVNPLALRPRE